MHSYPNALALEDIKSMVLEPNADVSRTVVRLAEKGFIEKVVDKNNRRKLSIRATKKGITVQKKNSDSTELRGFTPGMTLRDATAFVNFLKGLRKDA